LLREKCPATRVIMLSMHSNSEHVHRAFEAGASGFVLKDSAGEEVCSAVRAAHAGRRYLSRAIEAPEADCHDAPARGVSPLERPQRTRAQVLQLVVEGRSSAEIAATIHLSPKTVETYRGRLMAKTWRPRRAGPGALRDRARHDRHPARRRSAAGRAVV
jgi:DNA-binding NarL/FixJ family response regulator